jgi:hypothetical protein
VQLKTEQLRREDSAETTGGFGIRARVDLEAEEWLFELAGLVPTNSCDEHDQLSVIKRSNHGQRRLLAGPIRFINHICRIPNAQVRTGVAWLRVFTD